MDQLADKWLPLGGLGTLFLVLITQIVRLIRVGTSEENRLMDRIRLLEERVEVLEKSYQRSEHLRGLYYYALVSNGVPVPTSESSK